MPGGIDQLRNMRVLVVEDSPLVAMMLTDELEFADAFVVGPAASIAEALALVETWQVDAAILDIELQGTLVYPLADLLLGRAVPFIITTGYDAEILPDRFAGIPNSAKPAPAAEVLVSLAAWLSRGG